MLFDLRVFELSSSQEEILAEDIIDWFPRESHVFHSQGLLVPRQESEPIGAAGYR